MSLAKSEDLSSRLSRTAFLSLWALNEKPDVRGQLFESRPTWICSGSISNSLTTDLMKLRVCLVRETPALAESWAKRTSAGCLVPQPKSEKINASLIWIKAMLIYYRSVHCAMFMDAESVEFEFQPRLLCSLSHNYSWDLCLLSSWRQTDLFSFGW